MVAIQGTDVLRSISGDSKSYRPVLQQNIHLPWALELAKLPLLLAKPSLSNTPEFRYLQAFDGALGLMWQQRC